MKHIHPRWFSIPRSGLTKGLLMELVNGGPARRLCFPRDKYSCEEEETKQRGSKTGHACAQPGHPASAEAPPRKPPPTDRTPRGRPTGHPLRPSQWGLVRRGFATRGTGSEIWGRAGLRAEAFARRGGPSAGTPEGRRTPDCLEDLCAAASRGQGEQVTVCLLTEPGLSTEVREEQTCGCSGTRQIAREPRPILARKGLNELEDA